MKNTLLDIIQSPERALDLDVNDIRDALDTVDDLSHRQIKNVLNALLDKYSNMKKGTKAVKTKEKNQKEKLAKEVEKLKENKKVLEKEKKKLEKELKSIDETIKNDKHLTKRIKDAHKKRSTLACIVVSDLPIKIAKRIMEYEGEDRDDELLAVIEEFNEQES